MKIIFKEKYAYVFTPYNQNFVTRIRRMGDASWDRKNGAWRVPVDCVPAVRQMMVAVYGESDIKDTGKRYDVKLTFHKAYAECQGDVIMFGKILSHAYGRDSGGKPGSGVCYIEGAPNSGGSVARWESVVEKGSVVMIYDVPALLIEREPRDPDIDYEVTERVAVDKLALETEKQKLLDRIAAIDAMLNDDVSA